MKKILAFLTGCTVAVSSFAFTAFAEADDITVTFGELSSGENWSYDGNTLTLEGGEYGDILFDFVDYPSDPFWKIVLNGDSTVDGIYANNCYTTDMLITSDSGYTLNASSIGGSGCDNDIITFDGVTVNVNSLWNGASGAANSNIALINGAEVNVSSQLLLYQNISLTGNSTLNANAGLYLVGVYDNDEMTCSFGEISIESGSYINCTGEIYAVYSSYYSDSYDGIFDTSVLRVNSPLYWSNYYPSDSSETYFTVLDENGIPVKSISFTGYANSKKVTDPDDEDHNSANFDMTGTYGGSADDEQTVYSVDVTWGSMEFTYSGKIEGTWDPATHEYDGAESAGWSCGEGANEVTVTNHSNADVNVSFGYTPDSRYNVSGSFDKTGTTTLTRGVENDFDNADSVTASLTLDNSTAFEASAEDTVIGSVTVSISEPQG